MGDVGERQLAFNPPVLGHRQTHKRGGRSECSNRQRIIHITINVKTRPWRRISIRLDDVDYLLTLLDPPSKPEAESETYQYAEHERLRAPPALPGPYHVHLIGAEAVVHMKE